MDDQMIQRVMNIRAFKTQSHKVANLFNIPDRDAEMLLLERVLDRGNYQADWPDRRLSNELEYSYRDLRRDTFRDYKREEEKATCQGVLSSATTSQGLRMLSVDEMRAMIPHIKFKGHPQAIMLYLLEHGADATREHFGYNRQQWQVKFNNILRMCEQRYQEVMRVVNQTEQAQSKAVLQTIANELESLNCDENRLTDYMSDTPARVELCVRVARHGGCANPRMIVFNFKHAPKADKYRFINQVYKELELLDSAQM